MEGDRPIICVLGLPHFGQVRALSVGLGIVDAVPTNNAPPQAKSRKPYDRKLLSSKTQKLATRRRVQRCAILEQ